MVNPILHVQYFDQLVKPLLIDLSCIHQNRKRHIFLYIEDRDQIVKLVNKPYLPSSENGKSILLLCIDVFPIHIDLAGGRPVHPSDQMKKCGFSGS